MPRRAFVFLLWAFLAASGGAGAAEAPPWPRAEGPLRRWVTAEWSLEGLVPPSASPFDPAVLAVDAVLAGAGGKTWRIPAFYGHALPGAEEATPGDAGWRLRFLPPVAGTYEARLLVRENGADERLAARGTFRVGSAPRDAEGRLRVGPHRQRFATEAGRGVLLVGHNVCWVEAGGGAERFDLYFRAMEEAGENHTRLWLCTWGLRLETARPYRYDLEQARRLDAVLERARRRGIWLKLCLYNFHDLRENFDRLAYAQTNGGPCRTRRDFFLLPEARRMTAAKLRYLVARYGAVSNLFLWELFNEISYALPPEEAAPAARSEEAAEAEAQRILLDWTDWGARTLHTLDPARLGVTTSLGNKMVWPALWDSPAMAVAQLHAYIDPFSAWYRPAERDAAAFVLDGAAPLLENGKPVLVSEIGYRGSGASAPMNGRDPEGIALHNALWAGVFGGAAGTPMLWWWDNYIHPENLYTHYRGLTRTLAGTDWTAAWKPLRTEEGGLRVLALHRPRQTLLWVQNLQNVWFHRILQGKAPARIEDAVLHLDGFAPGSYTLAWIDPYSGSILGKKRLDAPAGHLRIEVPAFSTDLAARIVHVGAASSSAERAGSITE